MHIQRLQVEQGILNAVVVGEFELGPAQRQFNELVNEAVQRGASKVLIEGRQVTGKPNIFERFLYGLFVATASLYIMNQHNIRLRFAYVIHEQVHDPGGIGETVAVKSGMDVKSFEDTNAAIEWLNAA